MPAPRPSESQPEFMSRCMSDAEARRDFPDEAQRAAFCYAQWRTSPYKGESAPPRKEKDHGSC